jgi:phage recombination protein Bet
MSAATSLAVRVQAAEIQTVTEWDTEQRRTLRDTVARDCNEVEFQLFAYVCRRTGLDPFRKQIYAIKRQNRVGFQTGIDGFRAIASRNPLYEGQTPPQWCGDDGVWRDVWLSKTPPAAARVGVYRRGCREPFMGVARTDAYRVDSNELWKKMPDVMIAKCAEALALRKAFPEDLSGVHTKDEMDQADDIGEPAIQHAPSQRRSDPPPAPVISDTEREKLVAELRAGLKAATVKATLKLAAGECVKAHKEGRINDVDRLDLANEFAAAGKRLDAAPPLPTQREPGSDDEEDQAPSSRQPSVDLDAPEGS